MDSLFPDINLMGGMMKFKEHVARNEKEYLSKRAIPKNFVWRPQRFAVRDVIIGLTVVRHNRKFNILDVDVCLMDNLDAFEDHSGAKMMLIYLISEAFYCGGSLEIRFTENVEGGRIPEQICDYAKSVGINLLYVDKGQISPGEARLLYLSVTDFSKESSTRIKSLAMDGKLSIERACFMVHHGVWTLHEMESIVMGSIKPERLILGKSLPEIGVLYQYDLSIACNAILGGFLDRKILRRERIQGDIAFEIEADDANIDIGFDSDFFAKKYISHEKAIVPWEPSKTDLSNGKALFVALRCRTDAEIRFMFYDDLKTAINMKSKYDKPNRIFAIIYPRDFSDIPELEKLAMLKAANDNNILIMICPEKQYSIAMDAAKRLETSRRIRQ